MAFAPADDGCRIHYSEWGNPEGEAVLLLHGLGTDNLGWIRQRRAFGHDYRCIAIDNRGSGRSDKPEGAYQLTTLSTDAIAVLDHVGVERAHVVGASMGGILAQILAVSHPDRIISLTLACTACTRHRWREEMLEEWVDLIGREGMREFAVRNLEWIFGPRSLRRLWPVAKLLGPMLLRSPEHAFLAQLGALLSVNDEGATEELAGVTAPTLVVTGSQDLLTPVADAEEIAARIPGAELVIIRGAAHGFMLEAAGPFNQVVLDFVKRHPDAAPMADVIPIRADAG
jgi:3-oxoadipate enol-lactonase